MPRNVLTLMDKIERAKQFGLAQQPVQQLAADAGRVAAPTTATETGVLGGTPQQQAMAGTPAQKKAVVKVAAPTGESELEQAQTLAPPQAPTAEDEAKKAQAKQLVSGLGTFGAKVSEWVNSAKTKLTAAPVEVQVEATDKLLQGLPADKKADAMDLIKKIATAASTNGTVSFGGKQLSVNEAEQQLNLVLGKDASTVLTPEEMQKMYGDVGQSMSAAVEAGKTAVLGADRKLTLSDLGALGTTQEELAGLLGVAPADIPNMTITQVQQKIAEESQRAFGTAQAAQAGMASAVLSPTDRAALRQYLRGVEQTGVAGAEAAVAGLASDIDKGRMVSFGGKAYPVEELLESTAINDIVKQVMGDPTGPIATEIAKTEPDFLKWVTDNVSSINTLIEKGTAATKSYAEMQTANRAALGVIGTQQPELAKALGYDPKELRTEAIDTTKLPGAFQSIAALPADKQQAAAATLANLNQLAPGQVKDLTKDLVDKLDLTNPEGPAAQYARAVQDQQKVSSLTTLQDIANEYLAEDMSIDEIDDALTGDALAQALELPRGNASQLDYNHDGKFDAKDLPGIVPEITGKIPPLAEVAAGKLPTSNRNSFRLTPPEFDEKGDKGAIFRATLPLFQRGKPVTADSIRGLNISDKGLSDMYEITAGMSKQKGAPAAFATDVNKALSTLIAERNQQKAEALKAKAKADKEIADKPEKEKRDREEKAKQPVVSGTEKRPSAKVVKAGKDFITGLTQVPEKLASAAAALPGKVGATVSKLKKPLKELPKLPEAPKALAEAVVRAPETLASAAAAAPGKVNSVVSKIKKKKIKF